MQSVDRDQDGKISFDELETNIWQLGHERQIWNKNTNCCYVVRDGVFLRFIAAIHAAEGDHLLGKSGRVIDKVDSKSLKI